MYNCIQANLHNSRGAEDMLYNFAIETGNNVQLISEFPVRDRSRVLELAAGNNLVVLNSGNTPTYERPGWGWSIPDVTLASEGLVPRVED